MTEIQNIEKELYDLRKQLQEHILYKNLRICLSVSLKK